MLGFGGGFLVDFFVLFSGGKQAGKNQPKNPPFSRQLFDQNPLREVTALISLVFLRNDGSENF